MRQLINGIAATLALCAVAATGVQAQMIRPGPEIIAPAEQGLTVHGHAEIKVKPDIAYVNVGVVTQAHDAAQAEQENAVRATALVKALKKAGIADGDIQSQSYDLQPQYDYKASPALLTGYQVTNSFQVTVRDLTKAGAIIDLATQAGSNQISGVTFDLADRTQAEARALAMAIMRAHVKATLMAKAAQVSLGRLVDLSEGSPPVFEPIVMHSAMLMKAAAASTPVQPQEIKITADVTALYAIDLP
jgi:hypothetical protein